MQDSGFFLFGKFVRSGFAELQRSAPRNLQQRSATMRNCDCALLSIDRLDMLGSKTSVPICMRRRKLGLDSLIGIKAVSCLQTLPRIHRFYRLADFRCLFKTRISKILQGFIEISVQDFIESFLEKSFFKINFQNFIEGFIEIRVESLLEGVLEIDFKSLLQAVIEICIWYFFKDFIEICIQSFLKNLFTIHVHNLFQGFVEIGIRRFLKNFIGIRIHDLVKSIITNFIDAVIRMRRK